MIQDLGKRMEAKIEKMQEMFTKDLEELKNKQTDGTLEGINSKITDAEERINDLEDRMVEITATEQNIEKRMKRNDDSLRDLRRAERSYSTFKVRRGGSEEIPLVQGKEQWLRFAGAAVKRYPMPKVRETQVRQ